MAGNGQRNGMYLQVFLVEQEERRMAGNGREWMYLQVLLAAQEERRMAGNGQGNGFIFKFFFGVLFAFLFLPPLPGLFLLVLASAVIIWGMAKDWQACRV